MALSPVASITGNYKKTDREKNTDKHYYVLHIRYYYYVLLFAVLQKQFSNDYNN